MVRGRPRKDQPYIEAPRNKAKTAEARESQLIAAAYDLAERRIREGTASAQEVTTFLKLGSSRERLEQERLVHENRLLVAKQEAMASAARVEELYIGALNAMRSYQGQDPISLEGEVMDDGFED